MFGCAAAHISNNLIILLPEGVKRKLIEGIPGYRLQALNICVFVVDEMDIEKVFFVLYNIKI